MSAPLAVQRFAAFDGLATWVAVLDAQGLIVFTNPALQEAIGLPRRSLLGRAVADWLEQPAELAQALAGAHSLGYAVTRYDDVLVAAAGERLPVHVVLAKNPTSTDAGGDIILEMLPAQRQTQQEREQRLLDQAQANKVLMRNLAHEIKNPLGGIRGAAQLLQMEPLGKEQLECTQVIIGEVDRLQNLVDRLLAPHRRAPVLTDVNIHEVCERVRAVILAEFPQGLRVQRDYDISIPEFRGDREQLIQALLNVAHNAAQALSERIAAGSAALVLRTRVQRQVTLGRQRHRLALVLHVIDNGPGVPAELKERIFYPLVSGREGGTGLGLTLAQTVLQQHQGLLECDSQPGRTDFKFVIPLQQPQ